MNYPDWAPPVLIEKHKRMVAIPEGTESDKNNHATHLSYEPILRRLLTDVRMRYVWSEVCKNHPLSCDILSSKVLGLAFKDSGAWEGFVATEVVSAVISAKQQFHTRKQKREQYERVAELARQLGAELKSIDLDYDPAVGGIMRFIPEKVLAALLSRFDPVRWEGDYCDAFAHIHRNDMPEWFTPHAYTRDSEGEPIGPMLALSGDLYGSFYDYAMDERTKAPAAIPMIWPTISEVLHRLEDQAKTCAERSMYEQRTVERDTDNREATHAIRLLSRTFYSFTGKVLRGTVANLVSVALDLRESLDDKDVDNALRGFDYKTP